VKRSAINRALIALALTGLVGVDAHAASRSLARSDLAARSAAQSNDLASPSDDRLRERELNFKVMEGDMSIAITLAEAVWRKDPENRLANLTLVTDSFASGSFDAALDRIETSAPGTFPPLLSDLLSGWAQTGRGDSAAAEAAFVVGTGEGNAMYDLFGGYHRGLSLMTFGKFEEAAKVFEQTAAGAGAAGARLTRAHGLALEAAGRPDDARALWAAAVAEGGGDVLLKAELARIDAGAPGILPVRSARSGAAEVMFSIADALSQEHGGPATLIYTQLALSLQPELHEARLLLGESLSAQSQFALAAEVFAAIPQTSPFHLGAEVGLAEALRRLDREPKAIVALQTFTQTNTFDGLFRPKGEEFSNWNCESIGQDGGAYSISGLKVILTEEVCTLSNPIKMSEYMIFDAKCEFEGFKRNIQIGIKRAEFGAILEIGGVRAEWQNCNVDKSINYALESEIDVPAEFHELFRSANEGLAASQFELAQLYDTGEKIPKEYIEAFKWYKKASEQGYLDAQYQLALMYESGRGTWKSIERYIFWARKAAEGGHAPSQLLLARAYGNGVGVREDYNIAMNWWIEAANNGNADAQNDLGWIYEKGQGVRRNRDEALRWYRMASEQGHARASDNFERLSKFNGPTYTPKSDTYYAALVSCVHFSGVSNIFSSCLDRSVLTIVKNGTRSDYEMYNLHEAGSLVYGGTQLFIQLPRNFNIIAFNSSNEGMNLKIKVVKVEMSPGKREIMSGVEICNKSSSSYAARLSCSSD
jgi:hypothetical protein